MSTSTWPVCAQRAVACPRIGASSSMTEPTGDCPVGGLIHPSYEPEASCPLRGFVPVVRGLADLSRHTVLKPADVCCRSVSDRNAHAAMRP
jgi:hypothetical protein